MSEEQTTTPANSGASEVPTGDGPGKQTEEPSIKDLIGKLSTDELDDLILGAAPDKFVSKDKVEEIVTERLNSEREQRKAEAERTALEEQNEFKQLYEKEKERAEKLEADQKAASELARTRLINNELKLALLEKGARGDRINRLINEADVSSVEVDGEEVKNLDPVVASLEKDTPEWFGASAQDIPGSPPAGDPSQLTNEKRKEQAEIASRQLHRAF